MATNYEILTGLSKKQMAAFINSLVKKEVSRYIDWNAWLNSEDPEPPHPNKLSVSPSPNAASIVPVFLICASCRRYCPFDA